LPREIIVSEGVKLDGVTSDGSSLVLRGANGKGGLLNLTSGAMQAAERALISTDRGIYLLTPEALKLLDDRPAEDLYWDEAKKQLFVLRAREIFAGNWDGVTAPVLQLTHLLGQRDLVFSNVVSGFAPFPVDGQILLAVLTDRGISLWRDAHFEHFSEFPHKDETVAVQALASAGDSAHLLTSEGLYVFERGQAIVDTDGTVFDLLSLPKAGVVAVARGDRLDVVLQNDPGARRTTLASVGARVLAMDAEGRLLTNDGPTILRYDADLGRSQELFSATPHNKDKSINSAWVTSLLVAQDGTVWATAGSSVFHYDGSMATEYSALINPGQSPIWSDMISRVVQTFDGRIWVVASDESHRNIDGIALSGAIDSHFEYGSRAAAFRT
jgi:hypothetical protein